MSEMQGSPQVGREIAENLTRPRLEIDYAIIAARTQAAQIISLTIQANREIQSLAENGNRGAARAREDMWREEIFRVCMESHKAVGEALNHAQRELTDILAEYLRPVVMPAIPVSPPADCVPITAEEMEQYPGEPRP